MTSDTSLQAPAGINEDILSRLSQATDLWWVTMDFRVRESLPRAVNRIELERPMVATSHCNEEACSSPENMVYVAGVDKVKTFQIKVKLGR